MARPLLPLLALLPSCLSTYRLLSLPELCRPQPPRAATKVALEAGGAAVVELRQGAATLPYWRCDLEVAAAEGFGLMVEVEEAWLRPGSRQASCTDYLQLGRDDKTPFFTWDKTDKLCGDSVKGTTYDVPDGQLLLWLRLGGPAGLETSGASLVLTTYLLQDAANLTNYRACSAGGRFIRRGFFCDGRTNCAADPRGEPADESERSCGGAEVTSAAPALPPPHLNLLTVTLVLVSAAVLLLALLLLAVRLRRHNCCFHRRPPTPELPDRSAPSQCVRQARPHTLLHASRPEPPVDGVEAAVVGQGRGDTPDSDSEPPPAYCELFPAGFVFEEEKTETGMERTSEEEEPLSC